MNNSFHVVSTKHSRNVLMRITQDVPEFEFVQNPMDTNLGSDVLKGGGAHQGEAYQEHILKSTNTQCY